MVEVVFLTLYNAVDVFREGREAKERNGDGFIHKVVVTQRLTPTPI
jgi:hypothetical protein